MGLCDYARLTRAPSILKTYPDGRTELRAPCLNPNCGRTWKHEGHEVICNRCFRLCPVERRRYKALKRRLNHAKRWPHKWTDAKLDQLYRLMDKNWARMKRRFYQPEKPVGLDGFLEEMGLN